MKFLADLGLNRQFCLRTNGPHIPHCAALVLAARKRHMDIAQRHIMTALRNLMASSSAAAMWTANAATICPSVDAVDKHVHITPANLEVMFHRSIEAETTEAVLRKIFSNHLYFKVHEPLPSSPYFWRRRRG